MSQGTLYLCGTPIGNLEDISRRALKVLEEVDVIGAEDTRWSKKLLDHYGIKKRLFSCYEHNEMKRVNRVIEYLNAGQNVALITGAGMPGVSDPGTVLVDRVQKAGFKVEVIPGPSAITAALSLSGWGGGDFYFAGFLPRSGKSRTGFLEFLRDLTCPAVIFESPRRLKTTLKDLIEISGEKREIFLARELTKFHEENLKGSVEEVFAEIKSREEIKGEITLVLRGTEAEKEKSPQEGITVEDVVAMLQKAGLRNREIVDRLSEVLNWPKNKIYSFVHKK